MIGIQYVLYSLMLVEGWRRPNRVPTLLRAKNALRAELARSIVLLMEDVPTVRKTPRRQTVSLSGTISEPRYHFRESLFLVLDCRDSPNTSIADLLALNL